MGEVHKAGGVTLLALPYVSKGGFLGACVKSLMMCFASGKMGRISFLFIPDRSQVNARNYACEKAIEIGAEWLWFVDSDQDFPVDVLERLKLVDADVACPDMWSRSWPSYRIVLNPGPTDGAGKVRYLPVPDEIADRGQIEDVGYCGMGCTLIKVSAIVKMRELHPNRPWFWAAEHGEDATFCFQVSEMGGTIKCDFGVQSGHWGVCRNSGQDFTRRNRVD